MVLLPFNPHVRVLGVATVSYGRQIGIDVFLPHSQTGEDVRWHVQSVRSCGSNLRVAPRRRKSQLGHSRIVVRMNQVMRYSWMVRLQQEQLFQDSGGRLPVGMGWVVAIRIVQCECIKSRAFM